MNLNLRSTLKDDKYIKPEQFSPKSVVIGAVKDKKDPIFGPIMMLGFGGIYAEILKDVKFCKLPLDQKQIVDMIKTIKSGGIK